MTTEHTSTDEMQTALDELGADVDLSEAAFDDGIDFDTDGDGMEFVTGTILKPVAAGPGEEIHEYTREGTVGSTHYVITVQERAECPSCKYPSTQEGEPITLTGTCVKCGEITCSNCGANCFSCDKRLCRNHKEGYGMMGEVLCHDHRLDFIREKEAEFKIRVWKQRLEEELKLRESENEREIAFAEMVLDAEIQREQMALETKLREREQALAEFEAQSQHLDRVAKQELEREKHELDKYQTVLEQRRKDTQQALDALIDQREQALKEFETVTDKRIKKAEQALDERKQDFTEQKFDREQTHKEDKFEKEHKFEKEKFRKEHQLDRDEFEHDVEMDHREQDLDERKHETERDDKWAKNDLKQQEVNIKKKKQEIESWVKKRSQKLDEFKAVTQVKNGKAPSGRQISKNKPSWDDLMDVTQQLEKEPAVMEVKN